MTSRMVPDALRDYAGDAASALRRTPIEVALGAMTAVAFSVSVRSGAEEEWVRVGAPAALALLLVFGLSTLRSRGVLSPAARWAASAAVLLCGAAYGWWILDPERVAEAWRFIALLGAAAMALSLAPAVRVREGAARRMEFWRFNARLLTRIASVVAYAVALFAALAGAVAAVAGLFDLRPPEHLYADLAGGVFFALVPWVVAGGLPELVAAPAERDGRVSRPVRLLGRYLYAPVLTVYLAILLAYAVKVLATGEAPKNLLSPIILLAGGFGFLGSTLLEPLRQDSEQGGVARLIRGFPIAMLALLPFALWAVWVRREQYGWTEFRYLRFALLLALLALAVIGTVRLLRNREPVLLLVPVVLGATLLLSAVGPWGATAVSRRSQQALLRAGLADAGLLRGERVTRTLAAPRGSRADTVVVGGDTYERISGTLRYLYENHGTGAVQPLFATDVSGFDNGAALANALGLRAACRSDLRVVYASARLPEEAAISGLPAGTLYRVQATRRGAAADSGAVRLVLSDSGAVVIGSGAAGEWMAALDLRPLIERISRGDGRGCGVEGRGMMVTLAPADALRPLIDGAGERRGVLVITDLAAGGRGHDGSRVADGPLGPEHLRGLVLVAQP